MNDADLDRLAAALAPHVQRHTAMPPLPPAEPARDPRRDVSVEKTGVWMDYKTMTGILCALAVSVWVGSGWFSQLQFEMREVRNLVSAIPHQVEATINAVKEQLTDRIARLEQERASSNPDTYTRTAHDLWCLETEKVNRKIGWECAPLPDRPRAARKDVQPSDYYTTWSTETKKDRATP